MNSDSFLIIDQGSQSSRVLVFNRQGDMIAKTQQSVSTRYMDHGKVEQDAREILISIQHCLKSALAQLSCPPIAAGLICQRSSFLATRKHDLSIISPVVSWLDKRAEPDLHHHEIARNMIYNISGLSLNPHFSATKMAFLLATDQTVRDAAAQDNLLFLPLASYLSKRLSDSVSPTLSHDIASRTLLFDIHQQQWSQPLLKLFHLQRNYLPMLCSDFSSLIKAHRLLPFTASIPLALIGGDQSFLCCNIPVHHQSTAIAINCGTGAFLQMQCDDQTSSAFSFNRIGSGSDQTFNTIELSINHAALALEQLFQDNAKTLQATELQALFDKKKQSHFDGLVFYKIKALAKSINDKVQLFRHYHPRLNKIYISGGLANIDEFCQLLADSSQLTIYRQDITEASSLGAARYLATVLKTPIAKAQTAAQFSAQ